MEIIVFQIVQFCSNKKLNIWETKRTKIEVNKNEILIIWNIAKQSVTFLNVEQVIKSAFIELYIK